MSEWKHVPLSKYAKVILPVGNEWDPHCVKVLPTHHPAPPEFQEDPPVFPRAEQLHSDWIALELRSTPSTLSSLFL